MYTLLIFTSLLAFITAESLVLTKDNFDQHVLDPTKNVLIEFYAPCKYHYVRYICIIEMVLFFCLCLLFIFTFNYFYSIHFFKNLEKH